jgi:DNA invertase Pin-like site-specific DNA recombinase
VYDRAFDAEFGFDELIKPSHDVLTGGLSMAEQNPRSSRRPLRAAQYVRMSTEHQQYSTENQAEVIARYAAQHGMEIVKTYADSGKSGLTLAGREQLQKLLAEAESGHADFSAVLVYDVSRWGRFQDVDESAYHEYICRRAGVNASMSITVQNSFRTTAARSPY